MQRSLTVHTGLDSKALLLAIKPKLDATVGADNRIVDMEDPERRLLAACARVLQPYSMVQVLQEAGVHAEFITDLPCC